MDGGSSGDTPRPAVRLVVSPAAGIAPRSDRMHRSLLRCLAGARLSALRPVRTDAGRSPDR